MSYNQHQLSQHNYEDSLQQINDQSAEVESPQKDDVTPSKNDELSPDRPSYFNDQSQIPDQNNESLNLDYKQRLQELDNQYRYHSDLQQRSFSPGRQSNYNQLRDSRFTTNQKSQLLREKARLQDNRLDLTYMELLAKVQNSRDQSPSQYSAYSPVHQKSLNPNAMPKYYQGEMPNRSPIYRGRDSHYQDSLERKEKHLTINDLSSPDVRAGNSRSVSPQYRQEIVNALTPKPSQQYDGVKSIYEQELEILKFQIKECELQNSKIQPEFDQKEKEMMESFSRTPSPAKFAKPEPTPLDQADLSKQSITSPQFYSGSNEPKPLSLQSNTSQQPLKINQVNNPSNILQNEVYLTLVKSGAQSQSGSPRNVPEYQFNSNNTQKTAPQQQTDRNMDSLTYSKQQNAEGSFISPIIRTTEVKQMESTEQRPENSRFAGAESHRLILTSNQKEEMLIQSQNDNESVSEIHSTSRFVIEGGSQTTQPVQPLTLDESNELERLRRENEEFRKNIERLMEQQAARQNKTVSFNQDRNMSNLTPSMGTNPYQNNLYEHRVNSQILSEQNNNNSSSVPQHFQQPGNTSSSLKAMMSPIRQTDNSQPIPYSPAEHYSQIINSDIRDLRDGATDQSLNITAQPEDVPSPYKQQSYMEYIMKLRYDRAQEEQQQKKVLEKRMQFQYRVINKENKSRSPSIRKPSGASSSAYSKQPQFDGQSLSKRSQSGENKQVAQHNHPKSQFYIMVQQLNDSGDNTPARVSRQIDQSITHLSPNLRENNESQLSSRRSNKSSRSHYMNVSHYSQHQNKDYLINYNDYVRRVSKYDLDRAQLDINKLKREKQKDRTQNVHIKKYEKEITLYEQRVKEVQETQRRIDQLSTLKQKQDRERAEYVRKNQEMFRHAIEQRMQIDKSLQYVPSPERQSQMNRVGSKSGLNSHLSSIAKGSFPNGFHPMASYDGRINVYNEQSPEPEPVHYNIAREQM